MRKRNSKWLQMISIIFRGKPVSKTRKFQCIEKIRNLFTATHFSAFFKFFGFSWFSFLKKKFITIFWFFEVFPVWLRKFSGIFHFLNQTFFKFFSGFSSPFYILKTFAEFFYYFFLELLEWYWKVRQFHCHHQGNFYVKTIFFLFLYLALAMSSFFLLRFLFCFIFLKCVNAKLYKKYK